MDVTKLLKTLSLGQGAILTPHIDMYLERAKFPDKWIIEIPNSRTQGDQKFHPSSHCFLEPRFLYYDRLGELPYRPITAQLRKTFDVGHMWHGYLGEILVDMGFVSRENVERRLKYNGEGFEATGTADLVDVAIPGNGTWLVDMKTMSKREFELSTPNEYTFKKWEAQVNIYMDWLNVDKAMILAIEKDSPHRLREFQIQRKPDLVNEIYERWAYTADCIKKGTPPPCLHSVKPEPCELGGLCSHFIKK